jgi:hypothetical protein
MKGVALPVIDVLGRSSRVPVLAHTPDFVRPVELSVLVAAGAGAACLTNLIDMGLGIPGHRIIFSIFPLALGLALVPRRGAGSIMGASALAATGALWLAGQHVAGIGALTSLVLGGPMLDLALRWSGYGWRLYGAFILAGAGSNAVAFLVRAAGKAIAVASGSVGGGGPGRGTGNGRGLGGGGGLGRRLAGGNPLGTWLPEAVWTYALAGVLAGLLSAVVWFHLRERDERGGDDSAASS